MKNTFLGLIAVVALFGFTATAADAQPIHQSHNFGNGYHASNFNHGHGNYHNHGGYYYAGGYPCYGPGLNLVFSF